MPLKFRGLQSAVHETVGVVGRIGLWAKNQS